MREKYSSIRPGQLWLDTDGAKIEAHGGYIYYEYGTYYWYGENKEKTTGKGKMWTYGLRYYSSKDLYNWKDEGFFIRPSDDKNDPMFYERRIDRPHILKNEKTGKYVCWVKYNDTGAFALYTADHFGGPYTLIKKEYHVCGKKCGDFDFIRDEAGHPYLFVEVDHLDLLSIRLNDDYTDTEGEPVYHYRGIKPPFTREGVCCFRENGRYYLLTSGMMGYIPNPSEVAVSDHIQGPYTVLGDPHVDEKNVSSYNSQVSCIFRHEESGRLIALADRWVPDFVVDAEVHDKLMRTIASNYNRQYKATLKEKLWLIRTPMMGSAATCKSQYVMLPLSFEEDMPVIHYREEWKIDE